MNYRLIILLVLLIVGCEGILLEPEDCAGIAAGIAGGDAVEDCAGDCGGDAFTDDCNECVGGNTGYEASYTMDECGVCNGLGLLTFWYDKDGDGLGDPDISADYCPDYVPYGYVPNHSDIEPECATNDTDCFGICGGDGIVLWGECYGVEETTSLNLYNTGLTGEIPPGIGNLTNLTYLDLGWNQLTGEIPPEIGQLINLEYLDLYGNQLTGVIPPEIGNLTNLLWLVLYNNQLTGKIPSEIGNLTSLTLLRIDQNQLTGEIPSEIGNLTNLGGLNLNSNQLTGEIPPEVCDLIESNNWHPLWTFEAYILAGNNLTNTCE